MTAPSFSNHLVHEKSPYLQQHAHNPVDWYPWGEEAFALAQAENKPIFLSIGYATCHWCHVMEKETFENLEIGTLMNEVFVNIKVDREEMPEVDSVYMEFAQALMSSGGGWPLNVVLTPELKPFFAVTYLPPLTRRGMIGMKDFILQIKQLWESEDRFHLTDQADKIVSLFESSSHTNGEKLPSEEHILNAVNVILELADPIHGGVRGEPKFPLGVQANFLLAFSRAKKDSRTLFYLELTLDGMSRGGIYDHLGGGFSRYSVDAKWQVPHFEKMLYDNAILADAYLEAWKYTKKLAYANVCEETLSYLLREMAHPEGGFFSAQDADTEGHEGLFYTWTQEEIREVLSPEDAKFFCDFYGILPKGNFEGRSVLHAEFSLEEFAEARKMLVEEVTEHLKKARSLLLSKRGTRSKPFKDKKILTSWNGLAIHVFIKAADSFPQSGFKEAALKTAEFIYSSLWKERRLLHRFIEGEARFRGGLLDYAYLIKGVLSLFEAGCGSRWLQWAIEMAEILEREFKVENGAFYQTDGKDSLLIRKCEFQDGAEPSGNAVHCENLLRLFQLTQAETYLKQAEDILKASKGFLEAFPFSGCYHLLALQRYLDLKACTLLVALDEKKTLQREIQSLLASHFLPHLSVLWKERDDLLLDRMIPSLADKVPLDGQTAVYICTQDLCKEPLIAKEKIIQAIEAL